MTELPSYINFFTANYSPEFTDIIVSIECSFMHINYDKHIDLIDALFQTEGTEEIRTICDRAITVYRNHVTDACFMQGIELNNGSEDSLAMLAKLLRGIVVLASRPLEDILEGDLLPDEEDHNMFVCNILSITTDTPAIELYPFIHSISDEIVELLRNSESIIGVKKKTQGAAAGRFKRWMKNLKYDEGGWYSPVIEMVRKMGYCDYNLKTVIPLVIDELDEITDPERLVKEIIMLLAGTSIRSTIFLSSWATHIVEQLSSNHIFKNKVFALFPDWADIIE
jgi:hypothetical protein